MTKKSVAIVGFGPRGFSVLEQLVNRCRGNPNVQLNLKIFNPGEPGQGSHPQSQSDCLVTNTVSSQVGILDTCSPLNSRHYSSLTNWARHKGYKKFENGCFSTLSGGLDLRDDDHLPRSILGQYISDSFERVKSSAPKNISIEYIKSEVIEVNHISENKLEVVLSDAGRMIVDYCVLATGHNERIEAGADIKYGNFVAACKASNSNLQYIKNPYPMHQLDSLPSSAVVAVQGLGLTAYDVLAKLSVGRNGKFLNENSKLCTYKPSGDEPSILLFSRHCLPFAARAVNQKGLSGRHEARFFTRERIEFLREKRGIGSQLDFLKDVYPLILKEMAYAYRLAKRGGAVSFDSFDPCQKEIKAIEQIFHPLEGRSFKDIKCFRRFFVDLVEKDLVEAELGNRLGPLKAAADVIRDCRDALRAAIEFSGLTPDSHKFFLEIFNPMSNRVAFGPPKYRNYELLALMRSGLVKIVGGPGNRVLCDYELGKFYIESKFKSCNQRAYADVLISAKLDSYSPLSDSSRLSRSLLLNGTIRPFLNGSYHPGGLDVTEDMRVVDSSGVPSKNIWAIGYPVEGAHFYTHALPRPGMGSRFTEDAKILVGSVFSSIGF